MNKKEYERMKQEVINQLGKPEYDLSVPVNESAKKLEELKNAFIKSQAEAKKTKELAKHLKKLAPSDIKMVRLPEELLRSEWLVSFTENQRAIIKQWMTNVKQTSKEIADAVNTTVPAVNATKSLEAFKMLRGYLSIAHLDLMSFEAISRAHELLYSKNESVSKDVAFKLLINAGWLKQDSVEQIIKTDKTVLDKDLQEKYKALGDQILGIDSGDKGSGVDDKSSPSVE
jgi:hypothetical protein